MKEKTKYILKAIRSGIWNILTPLVGVIATIGGLGMFVVQASEGFTFSRIVLMFLLLVIGMDAINNTIRRNVEYSIDKYFLNATLNIMNKQLDVELEIEKRLNERLKEALEKKENDTGV